MRRMICDMCFLLLEDSSFLFLLQYDLVLGSESHFAECLCVVARLCYSLSFSTDM